jgi:hypothetical protein
MNQLHAPVKYRFGRISVLTLLILCALTLSLTGCDGGVGEVAAVDGVATDAAATAAADVAAETAADAVTETAIAGTSDVLLEFGSETIDAEPFIAVVEAPVGAEDLTAGLSAKNAADDTTITELDNETSGELQMIAMTTRSIYQAEAAFLDLQHKRLILKAIEKKGEAPTWGFFGLGDKVVSDLQQAKRLEFTAADSTPRFFTQQEPVGNTGQ